MLKCIATLGVSREAKHRRKINSRQMGRTFSQARSKFLGAISSDMGLYQEDQYVSNEMEGRHEESSRKGMDKNTD